MNKLSDIELRELRISSRQVERITNEVIEVMKKYNLSLNQAVVIFDSVKEELNNVPLWQETAQKVPVQEQQSKSDNKLYIERPY